MCAANASTPRGRRGTPWPRTGTARRRVWIPPMRFPDRAGGRKDCGVTTRVASGAQDERRRDVPAHVMPYWLRCGTHQLRRESQTARRVSGATSVFARQVRSCRLVAPRVRTHPHSEGCNAPRSHRGGISWRAPQLHREVTRHVEDPSISLQSGAEQAFQAIRN
jgi:hypothetical protein